MTYIAFGLNHETAPVEIREAFEFADSRLERLYAEVGSPPGTEWLVLSTCNRTEVYLHGSPSAARRIRAGIEALAGSWPGPMAFEIRGDAAVRHVIEVVSGLRSQVPGDAQILGQTKTAYRAAAGAGTLGPWMHRLMHTAFGTAKRVITETGLGRSGPSVARYALEAATRRLGAGRRHRCVVLGAGRMAQLVLQAAAERNDLDVTVVNRTGSTATELAARFDASVAHWEQRHALAGSADLVIGATSAHELVLHAPELPARQNGERTLLVDIAVPRDIDPAAGSLPGYDLVNIDALLSAVPATDVDLDGARAICRTAADELSGWERQHDALQPAIRTLYETFEAVRSQEVGRNLHRFDEADHARVERLTRSIMQKLLAVPVVRLKTMSGDPMDLVERISLLNDLFARPECEEAPAFANPEREEAPALARPECEEAPADPS